MKQLPFIGIILILSSFLACNNKKVKNEDTVIAEYKTQYAKGFEVKKYADYTQITVHDPWNTSRILQNYILVDKSIELPANLPEGTIIRTPLTKVAVYSTIHCTTLKELGKLDIIKAVCQPEYINIPEIKDGVAKGEIENIGMSISPDVEKIIILSPEVIFAEPVTGQTYGNITKTKIPIIETPDYTETCPLGRAEWIRLYSLLVGEEALGDSLFNETVKKYNAIKEQVKNTTNRPSVLMDFRIGSKWDIPGGKSFIAKMIADAGGIHPWHENESTTFLPLAFEAVLDKAGEADLWLVKSYGDQDMTYRDIIREYKPYSYLKPYKERKIWGCNTKYIRYYEDLPIHPDRILKDFAAIFHPELFPDYSPIYYKPLSK